MKNNRKKSVKDIIDIMLKDKRVRLSILKRNHKFFFYFYFSHYIEYEEAPFHREMFAIAQDKNIRSAVISGFRGCGKSTIFALSFPLWAILGEQKIKNVLLLAKTYEKAQMYLQFIKYEFETNELLRRDMGPFEEERNGWKLTSLYLPYYKARISIASIEQSVRSSRNNQYRPQLIIADDLEDLESVRTKESRDKTYNWFFSDVIPAGCKNTRTFVLGSLLHDDCLIKRLQKSIQEERMDGVFKEYPILDKDGNPTWPGKFPDQEAIQAEKRKGFDENTWRREYMLESVPLNDPIIKKEWIHYYDDLPKDKDDYRYFKIGIDPAISQSQNADFTAMVGGKVYNFDEDMKIYIMPNPVNERLSFTQTIDMCKSLQKNALKGDHPKFLVERVAYQQSLLDALAAEGIPAEGVPINGQDKKFRLELTANMIKSGRILFPKEGAERLIEQILYFELEKHDDLVDAFTILILGVMGDKTPQVRTMFLGWGDEKFSRFGNVGWRSWP